MQTLAIGAGLRILLAGAIALGAFGGCGSSGATNGHMDGGSGTGGSGTGGTGGSGTGGSGTGSGTGGSPGTRDAAADHSSTTDAGDAGAPRTQAVYMTFYGWPDNSPPGNAIAYSKSDGFPTVHNGAGGTGTYADPITFATDQAELPVGTLLYAPVLQKYLVMEDDCAECDTDWAGSKKWHIDVWMNSNATADWDAVLGCEDQWTQTTTTVELDPPPGRNATTPPLFDTSTNACRTTP